MCVHICRMKMMRALSLNVSSDYWSATEPIRGKRKLPNRIANARTEGPLHSTRVQVLLLQKVQFRPREGRNVP